MFGHVPHILWCDDKQMRSALYYPHTTVSSTQLLKTSLLLWDNLYVIVPWPHYQPRYRTREAADAFTVIGKCHYPSADEKAHAHELIEDFVKRPLPPAFSYSLTRNRRDVYDIYPEKLLPKTVAMLRERGMSEQGGRRNLRAPIATGLTLMNIVADCCAGTTLARVTDKRAAYANLAGLLVEKPTAELAVDQAREQLVPIMIRTIDVKPFSLKRLVDFRKREESSPDGSLLRALRHRLLDKVEEQAKRLSTAESELARVAIRREFEANMQDDYRDLRDALKAKATQTLATKELITAAITGVGSIAAAVVTPAFPVAATVSGVQGVVSIGGLVALKSKWVEERRKVLKEHATAYLYEASGKLRL
jgi:hypothetical protein